MLNKNIKFSALGDIHLTEKTIEYFQQSGFRLLEKKENTLNFGRGSIASNMWTFNPLKWKSEITIEIAEREIKADFSIDTTGQIVTLKEEALWDTFIENFRLFLTEGTDFKAANSGAVQATKKNSLKYVGWALLGGLIAGIPAVFFAILTGINSIAAVGAAMGAILLMQKKINDDKKKNAI